MSNDMFRMVCNWSLPNGSIGQNILLAELAGGDLLPAVTQISVLGDRAAWVLDPWLAVCSNGLTLDSVRIYEFDILTNKTAPIGLHAVGLLGLVVEPPLPAGIAVKVNLFPPTRARPAGVYLPACGRNEITAGGGIGAAAVLQALSVADRMTTVSNLNGGLNTYTPMYYSKVDLGVVSLLGSALQIDTAYDYMRSRKDGVGI